MVTTWTDREKAEAARLYASGAPVEEIASQFGQSRDAIYKAARARGAARPAGFVRTFYREDTSWPRVHAVLKSSNGMTVRELSEATGIPLSTVHDALTRHSETARVVFSSRTRGGPAPVWAIVGDPALPGDIPVERHVDALASSPFGVAAGVVVPRQTVVGRVYRQDWALGEIEGA